MDLKILHFEDLLYLVATILWCPGQIFKLNIPILLIYSPQQTHLISLNMHILWRGKTEAQRD